VQNEGELFGKIEALIRQHVSEDKEKAVLLECLTALQEETEKSERTSAYARFVQAAANYVTIFGPFLPALLQASHLNT
jgi:hypothetical protein